jgi:hypothetical protein
MWLKAETAAGRLATKRDADATIEWELVMSAAPTFIIYNSTGGTANTATYGGAALTTGVWYHIVGWHDSVANTVNITVDNGTVYSTATAIAPSDSTSSFRLGARHTTAEAFFDGLIEDVRFYKRVLTAEERAVLVAGFRGPLGSEVGWWSGDNFRGVAHPDGTTLTAATHYLRDESGNGNTGDPIGGVIARASDAPRYNTFGPFPTTSLYIQAATGALTFVGSAVKSAAKVLAGALTFAGATIRSTAKVLAGALTFAGAIGRGFFKTFTGALTFTGAVTTFISWTVGVITMILDVILENEDN